MSPLWDMSLCRFSNGSRMLLGVREIFVEALAGHVVGKFDAGNSEMLEFRPRKFDTWLKTILPDQQLITS